MTDPVHLQPTAPLAERVLLPGDPGRALTLAQSLLGEPKMFNHNRGLWGYTGRASDGELVTIQSTGMGGPSAAIVISELAMLGAAQLIRVGTCAALSPSLGLGNLVIASEAIPADGTSRALSDAARVTPDSELTAALQRAAGATAAFGSIVSTDLFYDETREQSWLEAGALAVEMQAATLFALAARRGLSAASLLIVSDLVLGDRARINPEALRADELRMGEVALTALASLAATSGR